MPWLHTCHLIDDWQNVISRIQIFKIAGFFQGWSSANKILKRIKIYEANLYPKSQEMCDYTCTSARINRNHIHYDFPDIFNSAWMWNIRLTQNFDHWWSVKLSIMYGNYLWHNNIFIEVLWSISKCLTANTNYRIFQNNPTINIFFFFQIFE